MVEKSSDKIIYTVTISFYKLSGKSYSHLTTSSVKVEIKVVNHIG